MAKLFLDGIFSENSNSPSTITISVPKTSGTSFMKDNKPFLRGLIIGDPTWTASNKWGPIINDLSNLQDWASLVGSQNQFSWINASTMCWKGTSPLAIAVDFYLINYSSKTSKELKTNLSKFVKLAAVDKDSTGTSNFRVQVHGGYAPNVLSGNQAWFSNADNAKSFIENNKSSALDATIGEIFDEGGAIAKGSLSIRFGHKSTIKNLLLSKVNVTESTIEVAGQNGENPQPLYYRVSAQFTGVQPLVTTEVDGMFSTTNS